MAKKSNKTGKPSPQWPSTTGKPSGGKRDNNPPKVKKGKR